MNGLPGILPPPPSRIAFGNQVSGLRSFTEPSLLDVGSWHFPLKQEGLYAILVFDNTWRPRPFRVLYFGESGDLWSRATIGHENYLAWQREAGTAVPLYRAFHFMPGSTQKQRQAAESELIRHYNPPCNQMLSLTLGRLLRSY